MLHACVWPKGIIYGNFGILVEEALGNNWLEVLGLKLVARGCLTGL